MRPVRVSSFVARRVAINFMEVDPVQGRIQFSGEADTMTIVAFFCRSNSISSRAFGRIRPGSISEANWSHFFWKAAWSEPRKNQDRMRSLAVWLEMSFSLKAINQGLL